MHKGDFDGETTGTDANQAGDLSRPAARETSVIPFRRAKTAAGPAASNSSSADELDAFIPVGEAVAAVMLRLRGGFPRIKVQRPDREDEG